MKTKWIAADFSDGIKTYDHIQRELSGIPVGILGESSVNLFKYKRSIKI